MSCDHNIHNNNNSTIVNNNLENIKVKPSAAKIATKVMQVAAAVLAVAALTTLIVGLSVGFPFTAVVVLSIGAACVVAFGVAAIVQLVVDKQDKKKMESLKKELNNLKISQIDNSREVETKQNKVEQLDETLKNLTNKLANAKENNDTDASNLEKEILDKEAELQKLRTELEQSKADKHDLEERLRVLAEAQKQQSSKPLDSKVVQIPGSDIVANAAKTEQVVKNAIDQAQDKPEEEAPTMPSTPPPPPPKPPAAPPLPGTMKKQNSDGDLKQKRIEDLNAKIKQAEIELEDLDARKKEAIKTRLQLETEKSGFTDSRIKKLKEYQRLDGEVNELIKNKEKKENGIQLFENIIEDLKKVLDSEEVFQFRGKDFIDNKEKQEFLYNLNKGLEILRNEYKTCEINLKLAEIKLSNNNSGQDAKEYKSILEKYYPAVDAVTKLKNEIKTKQEAKEKLEGDLEKISNPKSAKKPEMRKSKSDSEVDFIAQLKMRNNQNNNSSTTITNELLAESGSNAMIKK